MPSSPQCKGASVLLERNTHGIRICRLLELEGEFVRIEFAIMRAASAAWQGKFVELSKWI